jgi:hypothetical protein
MLGLAVLPHTASAQIIVADSAANLQLSSPDLTINTIEDFTPATGVNCKLVVMASWESATSGVASVTYSGESFTEAISSHAGRQSSIWYLDLDASSSSTGDVVVTFNAATDSRVGVLSLTNASPGAPAQTASDSGSLTASLSTTTADTFVVGVYTENGNGALSSDLEHELYTGDSGSSVGNAGYQIVADAGSQTFTWSAANSHSAIALAAFTHEAITVVGSAEHLQKSNPDIATNTIADYETPLGVNRKLVVTASWEGFNSISSISYGSQSFTEAITESAGRNSSIWYLDVPDFGSRDIVVTFDSATDSLIGAFSLVNAAPGAPAQTATDSATLTAGLTTSTADALVVGVYTENGGSSLSTDLVNTLYSGDGGSCVGHSAYQNETNASAKSYTWSAANNGSVVALAAFAHQASALTLDPQAIDYVLSQTQSRQEELLQAQLDDVFPSTGMWAHESFALSAYWLDSDKTIADTGLISCLEDIDPSLGKTLYEDDVERGHFHWNAYILERIYFLFSAQSDHFPGRMSTAAEGAVLEMLWDWAQPICDIEMADPDNVNFVWGSENHHVQAWASFWGAAQIFKDHDDYKNLTYDDGSTPAQMAAAFDDYFKAYTRNHSLTGLTVEVGSPIYAKYTLGTWYNLADFAEDAELKAAASSMLDIYWADWAIEQVDGVRGGSRHRSYPGANSILQSGEPGIAWFHFGVGEPVSKHPGRMCGATTFWRPSRATVALALDVEGRGSYEYASRRPGLNDPTPPTQPPSPDGWGYYALEPSGGSLLRKTWSTPEFVMGLSQVPALPKANWSNISGQNRWNGVVFSGDDTARIFTQPYYPITGSVYNAEWGVQHKGVQILQRLGTSYSDADGQKLWFDSALTLTESNDWIFVDAPNAYAAVRVVPSTALDTRVRFSGGIDQDWIDIDNVNSLANKTEVFDAGFQVVNFNSSTAASSNGNIKYQGGSDSLMVQITDGTDNTSWAWAPNVKKADFINGQDSSSNLSFENAGDSLSFSCITAQIDYYPVACALVKNGSNWYVSDSVIDAHGTFSVNGATESWYPYDPSSNLFYDASNPGAAVLGSTLTDIQAFGMLIQQEHVNATSNPYFRISEMNLSVGAGTLAVDFGGDYNDYNQSAYKTFTVDTVNYDADLGVWQSDLDYQSDGQWLVLNDILAPIIIEAAPKSDYGSMAAFQDEILANTLTTSSTQVDYTSANYGTTLTLYSDQSALPKVDGVTIDLDPAATYDSPYLNGDFSGELIVIEFGDERTIHGVAPFVDDSDTVALWHFEAVVSGTDYEDDTSVTARSAIDAVEHANSSASISVIGDGKFGNAIRCPEESGNQYMMTGSSAWPASEGTFRYQGWVRLNSGDTGGYLVHMYDQVYLSVSTSTVTFKVNKSGDVSDTSSGNVVEISADISTANDWQYIEAIYDGSQIQLITQSETATASGIGEFVPNNRYLYIGSRKNKNNFVGDMDEVKLSSAD